MLVNSPARKCWRLTHGAFLRQSVDVMCTQHLLYVHDHGLVMLSQYRMHDGKRRHILPLHFVCSDPCTLVCAGSHPRRHRLARIGRVTNFRRTSLSRNEYRARQLGESDAPRNSV